MNERLGLPLGETREYVLGDFDGFTHDGPGSVDDVPVAPDWLAIAQSIAANGWTLAGFDETGATGNQATPFTFDFALASDERVVAATLTLSMRRLGGSTRDDFLWL
ncbi:MAG: hypothetical protein ACI8QF_002136, partial [Limisphaerales bacterium]